MRVGVIGAGFAGLAAAVALDRAGADVLVLEARDRLGGRVWSHRLTLDGAPVGNVERGAEFVLDGYDVLRRHVAETGLHLADTGMSYYVRDVAGVDPAALRDAGHRLGAAVARAAEGTPAVEVVRGLELDPAVADALLARTEISCAHPADRLDAGNLAHVASFAPLASHRIGEGNQALADALAGRLGERVRRTRPVRRVVWDDEGPVEIVTDDGTVTVDLAVVAVPLAVLRDLPFSPPLPDWKRAALAASDVGEAAKLHVPLAATPSTSAVMSVPHRFWTWTASDAAGRVAPIVHAFAGSAPALAGLDVTAGPDRWVGLLRDLRPDLTLRDDAALLTTWSDDPWARGAYTAWPPGGRTADGGRLVRPVGPLHFAGEHTAGEWTGTMEGALRSGERAAGEVLRSSAAA